MSPYMYVKRSRGGKLVLVIDSRAPPRIRRAEARIQKRLRRSYEALRFTEKHKGGTEEKGG